METEFDNEVICEGCSDGKGGLLDGDHDCYGGGCPCCDGQDKVLDIMKRNLRGVDDGRQRSLSRNKEMFRKVI